MKTTSIALTLLLAAVPAFAQENEAHEKAEAAEAAKNAPALAAAMKEAKVSLAEALKACAKEGTPISAKFEVEDGKLQLSVYTMKGDQFFEVLVDDKTGAIVKTEPITEGEDLQAAKSEAAAMARTRRPLNDLAAAVEKAHPGSRVVSVTPEIEHGAAHADVTLLKGTKSELLEEKL